MSAPGVVLRANTTAAVAAASDSSRRTARAGRLCVGPNLPARHRDILSRGPGAHRPVGRSARDRCRRARLAGAAASVARRDQRTRQRRRRSRRRAGRPHRPDTATSQARRLKPLSIGAPALPGCRIARRTHAMISSRSLPLATSSRSRRACCAAMRTCTRRWLASAVAAHADEIALQSAFRAASCGTTITVDPSTC